MKVTMMFEGEKARQVTVRQVPQIGSTYEIDDRKWRVAHVNYVYEDMDALEDAIPVIVVGLDRIDVVPQPRYVQSSS